MLFMVGVCVLTTAAIVSAAIFLLLRSRHIGRQKLKEFEQSVDTEASRDYQVGNRRLDFESWVFLLCGVLILGGYYNTWLTRRIPVWSES